MCTHTPAPTPTPTHMNAPPHTHAPSHPHTHLRQPHHPSLPQCWLASKMSYGWRQAALCSHLWVGSTWWNRTWGITLQTIIMPSQKLISTCFGCLYRWLKAAEMSNWSKWPGHKSQWLVLVWSTVSTQPTQAFTGTGHMTKLTWPITQVTDQHSSGDTFSSHTLDRQTKQHTLLHLILYQFLKGERETYVYT